MTIETLRGLLEQFEGYKVPAELLSNDKENGDQPSTLSLLESYKQARNEYLRRRIQQGRFDHLKTFDGQSFSVPGAPTKDQLEDLRQDCDRKLSEVQERAKIFNQKKLELQTKYSLFQARCEQCKTMLQEVEDSENINDQNAGENEMDVDDTDLDKQKERLTSLELTRADLETQIRALKLQNTELKEIVKSKKAEISAVNTEELTDFTMSEESIQTLEARTAEAREKLAQCQEAKEWYDYLCGILEDLGGCRILAVERPNSNESDEEMIITLEVLKRHKINIGLKSCEKKGGIHHKHAGAKVCSAVLVTESAVQGPVLNEKGDPTVVLHIPDLTDLVRIAETRHWQENNLGFVVREAMMRISMIENRVKVLSDLQNTVLTKIERLCCSDPGNSFGGECQEVICSLDDEQISVSLRLTPDCPRVKGSVYIDQIVGFGGWDQERLDEMKVKINRKMFKSPVALINELREGIQFLQKEGFSLPRTPKLPQRQQVHQSKDIA